MKCIVTRTSCLGYDQKPCEEAVKEILTDVDERTIDDPMKNKLIGERWYTEEGYFNHRVENGHIKRDYKKSAYTIELESLEDLQNFIDKYGSVIIERSTYKEIPFEIEIYDEWRE